MQESLYTKWSEQMNTITIHGRLARDPEIKFFNDDKAVCNISVAVNRAYKDKDGNIVDYKTYAPKTQLHYFRCLSSIMSSAYNLDIIKENPVSKVSAPKVPRKTPQFLNVEESKNILHLLEKEPLKYQVGINILLYTGIRRRRIDRFDVGRNRLEK